MIAGLNQQPLTGLAGDGTPNGARPQLAAYHVDVLSAEGVPDLQRQLLRFVGSTGYCRYSAMVVLDRGPAESDFFLVENVPQGYRSVSYDGSRTRRDPVMQFCKRSSLPIAWDESTYAHSDQYDLWEEMAPFGYKAGIAFAMHMPDGRHFMLGVDRDGSLPTSPSELARDIADLQLFGVYVYEAIGRCLPPHYAQPFSGQLPKLSPRQLEVLRWTMEGKTAWEVANILGISESTAAHHLREATGGLGCTNKQQAVVKALRLGLIR